MIDIDDNINLAETIRSIAMSSKPISKILSKIQEAANQGKGSLEIEITEEDYRYIEQELDKKKYPALYDDKNHNNFIASPLIEKLLSFGFSLQDADHRFAGFWSPTRKYYVRVLW